MVNKMNIYGYYTDSTLSGNKLSIEENVGLLGNFIIKTNMNIFNNDYSLIIDKQLAPEMYEILHETLYTGNVSYALSELRNIVNDYSVVKYDISNISKYQVRRDRITTRQYFVIQNDKLSTATTIIYNRTLNNLNNSSRAPFEIDNNMTFGIEIECMVPSINNLVDLINSESSLIRARYESYNHTDHNGNLWKFVTDASLNAIANYETIEIVSPILKGENGFDQIKEICKFLDRVNAKVNRSCGLHVHFGAPNMNEDIRHRVCASYANNESIINQLVSPSRRENSYCKSLRNASARSLEYDRYYKVNAFCAWDRHKTVEFRQHQGTVNSNKIINWVQFTRNFLQRAAYQLIETKNNIDELLETIQLSDKLSYWVDRINDLQ